MSVPSSWLRETGFEPIPSAYETDALPGCATPHQYSESSETYRQEIFGTPPLQSQRLSTPGRIRTCIYAASKAGALSIGPRG